jgi:hypothetical protein
MSTSLLCISDSDTVKSTIAYFSSQHLLFSFSIDIQLLVAGAHFPVAPLTVQISSFKLLLATQQTPFVTVRAPLDVLQNSGG